MPTGPPGGIRRLTAVAETRRALLHARDRDAMLAEACRIAVEVAGLRMAWIGLLDDATGDVTVAAAAGEVDGYLDGLRISVGDPVLGAGPTGQALQSGAPVVSDDIANDPAMGPWRSRALGHGYAASAAVPITSDTRVVGALNVYAGEAGAFDAGTVAVLADLAFDIGVATERLDLVTELEQARAALREDLASERRAAEELRRIDEMKDAFLSAVSHELRTPLTALRGFALTLLDRLPDLDADGQRRLLGRLVANADRLVELVEDLLDIDRIGRGALAPHRRRLHLLELVRDTVDGLATPRRPVEVAGEDVEATLDGPKVERIVEHLVVNAMRHTPEGTKVEVRVSGGVDGALLEVIDDGPGLPRELRAAVLEPFRHGTAVPVRGAGIGLTVVRHLAELHGGWVRIDGGDPRGTRVSVWLPEDADAGRTDGREDA